MKVIHYWLCFINWIGKFAGKVMNDSAFFIIGFQIWDWNRKFVQKLILRILSDFIWKNSYSQMSFNNFRKNYSNLFYDQQKKVLINYGLEWAAQYMTHLPYMKVLPQLWLSLVRLQVTNSSFNYVNFTCSRTSSLFGYSPYCTFEKKFFSCTFQTTEWSE